MDFCIFAYISKKNVVCFNTSKLIFSSGLHMKKNNCVVLCCGTDDALTTTKTRMMYGDEQVFSKIKRNKCLSLRTRPAENRLFTMFFH